MALQIKETQDSYDVIIVGSGAGGGMASKILSEAGLSVAVVEAGGDFDPAKEEDRTQLRPPWESPRRGAGTKSVPLEILIKPLGDGKLMANPTLARMGRNLTGFDPEW